MSHDMSPVDPEWPMGMSRSTLRHKEAFFDVKYLMNGVLSGLVAVTGPCGVVEPWASVLIGAIAGLLYMLGTWALIKMRLDDAVDAIPGGSFENCGQL